MKTNMKFKLWASLFFIALAFPLIAVNGAIDNVVLINKTDFPMEVEVRDGATRKPVKTKIQIAPHSTQKYIPVDCEYSAIFSDMGLKLLGAEKVYTKESLRGIKQVNLNEKHQSFKLKKLAKLKEKEGSKLNVSVKESKPEDINLCREPAKGLTVTFQIK